MEGGAGLGRGEGARWRGAGEGRGEGARVKGRGGDEEEGQVEGIKGN